MKHYFLRLIKIVKINIIDLILLPRKLFYMYSSFQNKIDNIIYTLEVAFFDLNDFQLNFSPHRQTHFLFIFKFKDY